LNIVRVYCPEELQRRVNGALALYHIGPLVRATVRMCNREASPNVFAGPWLHFWLHGVLFVVLFGLGNWGGWKLLAKSF
jgi:hypothetical protein